ncbi:MAG: TetR family transcriptional regulator [Pseudomonadota bacterium]|nr:TetR family transcriptional regulator [Pseudomonadota bacterium]
MARTQAADYDKKRDAITRQAAKLFARSGFAGSSVSDLAAFCDVSKSLIYHYYPSKEAILFDVMNEHMETLLAAVGEDDKAVSPDEALRAFSRALMRVYVDAAAPQKVLLYELDSLPKDQRDEIVGKQRRLIDRVEAILMRAGPALKADRPLLRAKAMLFFGMLNWTHSWFKASGPISRDELADMAADTALKSLTA